jgi:protein-tyrosine kinase
VNLESRLRADRIVAPFLGEYEADVFRRLRTLVLQRLAERNAKTLGICSAGEGEGKSTIALNLAISMSLDVRHTVLLTELDFRCPGLHERFQAPVEKGLADVLNGAATIPECLINLGYVGYDRLTLLPARTTLRDSSEIIASPMMAEIARELRNRYPNRLIIYDLPPMLLSDDCLAFMEHLEAFLFVVGAGKASGEDIDRALSLADRSKLLGTVLNGSRDGVKRPQYYDEIH